MISNRQCENLVVIEFLGGGSTKITRHSPYNICNLLNYVVSVQSLEHLWPPSRIHMANLRLTMTVDYRCSTYCIVTVVAFANPHGKSRAEHDRGLQVQ
jgi:hypothetical protein